MTITSRQDGEDAAGLVQLRRAWEWLRGDLHRPYALALALGTAFLVGLGLFRTWRGTPFDWSQTFEAMTHALTSVAILVGGWWTVHVLQRRRAYAVKAESGHHCEMWNHGSGRVLRVRVSLRNCGDVPINPGNSKTRIQLPPDSLTAPEVECERSWSVHATIELPWSQDKALVEPGETESYGYDIPIPVGIRYLQVTTLVQCEPNAPDRFHWDETTLVDLQRIEAGRKEE